MSSAPADAARSAPELQNSPATPELRRVLGLPDLILLNIVAVVNLNLVPGFASNGFSSVALLIIAIFGFFLPQGVAVAEFVRRYPEEGGIYVWSKRQFGEFHGFLSGWCYATANIFYVPTLLFYLVGVIVYAGGPGFAFLLENRWLATLVPLALLWMFTALGILGWGAGKYVNRAGALGVAVMTVAMIFVGVAALQQGGGAQLPDWSGITAGMMTWTSISAFSVICLSFVGLELGSTMAGEIRDPVRAVPRATLIGGVACAVLYLMATVALLLAIPASEIGVLEGLLQGVDRMSKQAGVPFVMLPLAALLSLSIAGAALAWWSGSARVPFVAGLDRCLPAVFGRVHPRWKTPHVAFYAQAAIASALLLVSLWGVNIYQAYVTLLRLTAIVNLIPFLYLFAGLLRLAGRGSVETNRRTWLRLNGAVGFLATAMALVASFIPDVWIESVWIFETKLITGVVLFLGSAVVLFYWREGVKRRERVFEGAK